ncbi:MAG: hypothetical protein LQ352_002165 [Teloschistes flavicans]|nr:MAG: hypothetical protein LQ352_002165 [Teloschistes flavicans]
MLSPPEISVTRKRPAQAEEQSEPKRRLVGLTFPLSLRDPNRLVTGVRAKDCSVPDLSTESIPQSKTRAPFIDDDDDDIENTEPRALLRTNSHSNKRANELPTTATATDPIVLEPMWRATSTLGRNFQLRSKSASMYVLQDQLVAELSSTKPGKATTSFYGVEIHKLLEKAAEPASMPSALPAIDKDVRSSFDSPLASKKCGKGRTLLWTEKYRAKKFTDLVGDERTHRDVLRWVKQWDPIVFPSSAKAVTREKSYRDGTEDRTHRKILLLTGLPGLGKTTLAHVCARQAGYEVVEINASDERSRDVVKGRIRDIVGTENVRGVNAKTSAGHVRRAGRPVCVVVDEVDGVVGGNGGGGEGGFIKALIDLVALDQKNTEARGKDSDQPSLKRTKKGDGFRLLRPIILICNDVYHPALRPLRSAGTAEIVHVRKPPMDKVVGRLRDIFEKERIPCDGDGVRRLCEATWGVSNRREARSSISATGEGDIRGLLVVGEWVAAKLRGQEPTTIMRPTRLTRQWIQNHVLQDLSFTGSAARGLGRGGTKDTVERIFQPNAGYPKEPDPMHTEQSPPEDISGSFGMSEAGKRIATERLRDLVETSGEPDRIMVDCFATYASQSFQDDTLLSKPSKAYDWLHFHDSLSARVFSGQEWELSPYLSQSALGFHQLFASSSKKAWTSDPFPLENEDEADAVPFSGPRSDYEASETQKQNKIILQAFQSSLSIPLIRSFRSTEDVITGLLPYLIKILTPDVKPVIVGGSGEQKGIVSVRKKEERDMIERAVCVMSDVRIAFVRSRIEMTHGGGYNSVYRMEPPVDGLTRFETAACGAPTTSSTRYAIRQALDQEHQKFLLGQKARMAQAKLGDSIDPKAYLCRTGGQSNQSRKESGQVAAPKRDFFGRIVNKTAADSEPLEASHRDNDAKGQASEGKSGGKVFVSFHEGYSNAVRKPITLDDLMRGL